MRYWNAAIPAYSIGKVSCGYSLGAWLNLHLIFYYWTLKRKMTLLKRTKLRQRPPIIDRSMYVCSDLGIVSYLQFSLVLKIVPPLNTCLARMAKEARSKPNGWAILKPKNLVCKTPKMIPLRPPCYYKRFDDSKAEYPLVVQPLHMEVCRNGNNWFQIGSHQHSPQLLFLLPENREKYSCFY